MKNLCTVAILALIAVSPSLAHADDRLIAAAKQIEQSLGARVGLAVHDVTLDTWSEYHAEQRFPLTSTFKVVACAALLASAIPDEPALLVDELEDYSPVTKSLVGELVSPYALCEATMRTSDNTAANLVLASLGGPEAVTRYAQSIGDSTFRLDRWEPELNEGIPDDPRDTTTPRAMTETLGKLILGKAMSSANRGTLMRWLQSNEVAGPLFRAAIPADWRIADRTGAGGYGSRGIVAVMWPTSDRPVVVALYVTETTASLGERNAAIARFGRVLVDVFSE